MNFGHRFQENNFDLDEVRYFIIDASSSFYAQFSKVINLKVDEWLEERGAFANKANIESLVDDSDDTEDQPISDWLDRSDWPKSTRRGPLGLPAMAENSRRKIAVFQYVKKYIDKNKVFPTGAHLIDEKVPPLGGDFSNIPSNFNFEVNFPDK
jgi:hypothetical protein